MKPGEYTVSIQGQEVATVSSETLGAEWDIAPALYQALAKKHQSLMKLIADKQMNDRTYQAALRNPDPKQAKNAAKARDDLEIKVAAESKAVSLSVVIKPK